MRISLAISTQHLLDEPIKNENWDEEANSKDSKIKRAIRRKKIVVYYWGINGHG